MRTKKITIFIVDDSEITLKVLARELENSINCYVKTFTSAEECIRHLNEKPDIVLSDYYLDSEYANRMNGDQLLPRIKKNNPEIPVIMYSSKNSLDVVLRLMKLGATDFVPKESDFFTKILDVSQQQVKKIRREYEDRLSKKGVIIACLLLTAIIFLFQFFLPNVLPAFMISLYVIGCVWLIADGRRTKEGKRGRMV